MIAVVTPHPARHACLLAALALLCVPVLVSAKGAQQRACQANASRHHPHAADSKRKRARCGGRVEVARSLADKSKDATREAPAAGPASTQEAPPAAPPLAPETDPTLDREPAPTPEPEAEPDPEPELELPPEAEPEPPESADATLASSSIYWGAWIKSPAGEAPWSMTAATQFEQAAGKHVSLINWSSPFYLSACNGYCTFQTTQFDAVRSHGSIPFFSWNPGPGGGNFTDAKIAAGSQDAYITAWAKAAKSWGHPFFLRFAWEMNGPWFPWGVGNNGTTAANYVAMWRHVHDIFVSVGANNVTWVWCPNIDPYNRRTPMANVYPGGAYVDWTCLDGYNGANPWTSFRNLFKSSYDKITGMVAKYKPMIVGETASTEAGGSKAQWIADMLKALPTEFPRIRGLLWFDKVELAAGGHSDWPIESSAAATAAFAAGIHDSVYVGNNFANIGTSPIPPP